MIRCVSISCTHGNILHANDTYCRMIGYTLDQLHNTHISKIDVIDTHEDVARRLEKTYIKGGQRFEARHRRNDGSLIDIEVSCRHSSLYGGVVVSYLRDITEKKIMEKYHNHNSEFYKNITEINTDFIDRFLPDGIITYLNPALVRFTGVDAQNLLGKSFYPFVHEDDLQLLVPLIESIRRDNPVVELDTRTILPDGRVCWTHWTHSGIFDNQGNVIEYQGIGKDITERKQAEERLQHYSKELEDANTALRILMDRREHFQKGLEKKLQLNVEELVLPYLKKLRATQLDSPQNNYLTLLESSLSNIVTTVFQRKGGTIMAKILLIEDDEQLLKIMTSFLERESHKISTAADGKQGIFLLENQQFDLVITDIIMPEQDGIGVLMWLSKQTNRPKVIAISGGSVYLDQNHLLGMCKHLRADKVFTKPVELETLTSAIRELLENRN